MASTSVSWTQSLWMDVEHIYDAILVHPFVRGLTDASLPEDVFAGYIAQDAHYLRDYARALAVVAAKAPTHALTGMFAAHAAQTVEVELALHAQLLPALGIDPADLEQIRPSPTTVAYTSYLLRVAHGGSWAEGLAAVLPCFWIYQRVGAALLDRGSSDRRYQRWIDTYAGDDFAASVASVLEVADRAGEKLSGVDEAAARAHFVTTTRYEWMFWDAAWRREDWPV